MLINKYSITAFFNITHNIFSKTHKTSKTHKSTKLFKEPKSLINANKQPKK